MDFNLLRDVIVKQFPYLMIPPVSEVLAKKPDEIMIEKWWGNLERFLNKIMNSNELRASNFVLDFLTSSSTENIHKQL